MKVKRNSAGLVYARDMQINQMIEVLEGGDADGRSIGHILLMTFIGIVDLNNPRWTYSGCAGNPSSFSCILRGQIIEKGESITLTQD